MKQKLEAAYRDPGAAAAALSPASSDPLVGALKQEGVAGGCGSSAAVAVDGSKACRLTEVELRKLLEMKQQEVEELKERLMDKVCTLPEYCTV